MIKIGYTHYWTLEPNVSPSQLAGAIELMKRVIEQTDVPLAGAFGDGEPELSDVCVFNGKSPDDYETFAFTSRPGFNFCKTRGDKPYDKVVCACLLAAKYELDNLIDVSSDGLYPEEWKDGIALFEEATGFKAPEIDQERE